MLRICLRQSAATVSKVIVEHNVRREIRNTLQYAATKLLGPLTSCLPNAIIACSVRLERMPTCTPFQLIHAQTLLPAEVDIGGLWYDGDKSRPTLDFRPWPRGLRSTVCFSILRSIFRTLTAVDLKDEAQSFRSHCV